MPIQHISRTGKTYYLHVGKGKTGKPNYYFSTAPDGPLAQSVPPGFEVYEDVRGLVFLRRQTAQLITAEEVAAVRTALNRHAEEWRYKIELKKEAIVIHEASDNSSLYESIAMPWVSKTAIRESAIRFASYTAIMRFLLTDRERRLFRAERFCFRGSVDDWIDIGGAAEGLPTILRRFIRHLGRDSIFELY